MPIAYVLTLGRSWRHRTSLQTSRSLGSLDFPSVMYITSIYNQHLVGVHNSHSEEHYMHTELRLQCGSTSHDVVCFWWHGRHHLCHRACNFVSTAHVHSAVSIVHECTKACTFVEPPSTHSVEREDISATNLVYQHDFDSHLYLMCIVCIISFFQQGLHHFY